jgi:hypothetical protein
MLKVPSPFPQVGSYALLVDETLPITQQRAELVRVQRRDQGEGLVSISWPLRIGASGNRIVFENELIDGTELTKAEQRELTDLLNHCRGRARPNKAKMAQAEALRCRLIHSDLLRAELDKLARLQARDQPSIGSLLPRSEAA